MSSFNDNDADSIVNKSILDTSKWSILRSALIPSSQSTSSTTPITSINSFPGFNLTPFAPLSSSTKLNLLTIFQQPLPLSDGRNGGEEDDTEWCIRLVIRAVIMKSLTEDKR